MRRILSKSCLGAIGFLAACGGGGGDNAITLTNAGPVFSSTASISIEENTVGVVYTAQANDADGDTVTITVSGGPDAGQVSLNATSGELSFAIDLDFENPGDANADNIYEVSLEARDGRGGVARLDLDMRPAGRCQRARPVGKRIRVFGHDPDAPRRTACLHIQPHRKAMPGKHRHPRIIGRTDHVHPHPQPLGEKRDTPSHPRTRQHHFAPQPRHAYPPSPP